MSKGRRYEDISSENKKKILYISGIGAMIALIVIIFALSILKTKQDADKRIAEIENTPSDATIVSTTEDKTINEVKNNEENKVAVNTLNQISNQQAKTPEPTPVVEEPKKVELHFIAPLQGEIAKDFSDSSLVYSETLEEWTVHLGIDIKAEKGSAVSASEQGTVESIKNDPRYGLTVTIAHENGYKTIYSNLLSAEFVAEQQEVEKGQTIGSVGDNAAFEIADEAHLHFEMKKDGETVNPSNYWER